MDNFMQWITDHWGNVVALVGLLVGAFAVVAKFTPTPADDRWAAWLMDKLNILPVTAKQVRQEKVAAKKQAP